MFYSKTFMTTRNFKTQEGYGFTVNTTQLAGVSLSLQINNFELPNDVDYWNQFIIEYTKNIAEALLKQTTQIGLTISANGNFISSNSNEILENVSINSNWRVKLRRHAADRFDKIDRNFAYVYNPDYYHHAYQSNGGGSAVGQIESVNSIKISFDFPYEYNANALPTSYRLCPDVLPINALLYTPYNNDDYCILHCIFNKEYKTRKSLNADKDYMSRFHQWFTTHNLSRFYIENSFNLDNITELEDEIKANINIYTLEPKLSLYYRSEYKQPHDEIYNLVIIPMDCFYDNNNKTKSKPKKITNGINPVYKDNDFLARINIKEMVNSVDAHCCLLDTRVFQTVRKDGTKRADDRVCRYCTATLRGVVSLKEHEEKCKHSFTGDSREMRVRNYTELKNPFKDFKKFDAFYRVPFCTFDFETRLDENGQHIPFSYSILYLNVFDFSKSVVKLEYSWRPKKLIASFLQHVIEILEHHYALQSVEMADAEERREAVKPELCPWCLTKPEKLDYNHSHFEGDNLNLEHNRWICHQCNMTATLKNKPLRFYAHNGSKFDFNLVLKDLLNNNEFTNFEFLAKTESRFSEVVCSVKKNTCLRASFNDSLMLLSGSLAKLINAWVQAEDKIHIKTLLKLFYPEFENNIDPLVNISLKKQVFPYAALNDKKLLKQNVIQPEVFYDTLRKQAVEEDDYKEYLEANGVLQEFIGEEYMFLDYHNFYLQLDVILLALVLFNFMQTCFEKNKLNPLAYLSVSSYSMGALLCHNKYAEKKIPTIEIPSVEVQKFIRNSIKGGFTKIFNKQIPTKENSYCGYFDVNSLYPSVMTLCKLPYKFNQWLDVSQSLSTLLTYMERNRESKYFFVECDIAPLAVEFQAKVKHYPMFPENIEILPEYLSDDQKFRYEMNCSAEYKTQTANTVTFFAKKNYTCSYTYLKQALEVGYEVTNISKVAEFESDYIMKDYIEKMYQLKKDASIEKDKMSAMLKPLTPELNQAKKQQEQIEQEIDRLVEEEKDVTKQKEQLKAAKELVKAETKKVKEREEVMVLQNEIDAISSKIEAYKIILNGAYGACLISVDKHTEVEMLKSTEVDKLRKRISSFRHKSLLHLEDIVLLNRFKTSYQLSYSLSVGSAILFESKLIIARWVFQLYEWLKTKGLGFESIMTDTDSYIFNIVDFHNVFSSVDEFTFLFNQECYSAFDTSFNKPEYQMPETHQAFGHFKDECKGKAIMDFNGIAAKCYSYLTEEYKKCVKGKGIPGEMQRKYLTNKLYRRVINGDIFKDYLDEKGKKNYVCEFGSIDSKKMKLSNSTVSKSYVSLTDIKSWYGLNGIEYLIFGSQEHLALIQK